MYLKQSKILIGFVRVCKCEMPVNTNVFMPKCEACRELYHPVCINMTNAQAKQLPVDNYTCGGCRSLDGSEGSTSIDLSMGVRWQPHSLWSESVLVSGEWNTSNDMTKRVCYARNRESSLYRAKCNLDSGMCVHNKLLYCEYLHSSIYASSLEIVDIVKTHLRQQRARHEHMKKWLGKCAMQACEQISPFADSNSTLKNHISHPHCEALKRVSESGQSSMSRDGSIFLYNPDVLHEQFAGLVIQRGLPFNHFDDEQTTRVFQKRLQPKYNHRVIAFEDFSVPHTGSALARTLIKTFVNFNLENKIMSIALDNASNNTSAIVKVKLKYEPPIDDRASGGNQMSRLLNRLREHTKKDARNDPSLSSEYERYVNSDFVTLLDNSLFATLDLLGFWKAKESMFLIPSRMAMDIISVQATSVASESAFSTSRRVLSIRRTRLTLASLEMCMCLKDQLDAQERKQHKSGLENLIDFEEEILNAEVQQNKVIPLSEEEIAIDVATSEGTMSGSGSGGKEVDYDMTNYGYDDYE
uniref:Bromo adjacent homology (BAH) domain, zinc finger, RING/FYVE/PHD-type n=1 Tax=Tanacetum cinerariifolium TaxID=118510 RepID=A0A699HEB6_TANCI|nr:bromo adjacent homology (BAH) domain, zinc finger, RING/FYVE/PHD-type [Tanacetum cinerariifolium]